jgi:hypothetical protein
MAALAIAAIIVLLLIQVIYPTPPRYYASIVSVSGVADNTQRQRMQFALTLGVDSWSPLSGRPCLRRGTAVEVAYRGVPLAYGSTSKEVCAGPWPWKLWTVQKTTLVARRSGFTGALPESVVEGLVADMRRGVQVFDVTARIPSTRQDGARGDDDGKLASCMAILVGDDKAHPCHMDYS